MLASALPDESGMESALTRNRSEPTEGRKTRARADPQKKRGSAKEIETAQCSIRLPSLERVEEARLDEISQIPGVSRAEVNHINGVVIIDYDPTVTTLEELRKRVLGRK